LEARLKRPSITKRIDNITEIREEYLSETPPCPKSVKIELTACCFDHDGRFDMGDLKRTAFMDAWHSPDFRRLRAAHLREEVAGTSCEECVLYEAEGGPVGEPIRADASHDD
jgi:hypothetical protein